MSEPDPASKAALINEALGISLTLWGAIEQALATTFCCAVNYRDPFPAVHGFWAIANFEAKLKMTSAVVSADVNRFTSLEPRWSTLNNRLTRGSKMRNKFAHGRIQYCRWIENSAEKSAVLFVPFGHKIEDTFDPFAFQINTDDTPPKGAMKLGDIQGSISAMRMLSKDLGRFNSDLLEAKRREAHREKPDETTG